MNQECIVDSSFAIEFKPGDEILKSCLQRKNIPLPCTATEKGAKFKKCWLFSAKELTVCLQRISNSSFELLARV